MILYIIKMTLITNFLKFIKESIDNNIDWNTFNSIANKLIKHDTDKNALFDYLYSNEEAEEADDNINDNILPKLYNDNIITKNITNLEKIIMCLYFIQNIQDIRNIIKKYGTFEKWYKNAQITVYRGIPIQNWDESQGEINENEFKSFTLNYDTALTFTQYGWSDLNNTKIDLSERNGVVLKLDVPIHKIHIFNNNMGYELEIIVKGPLTCYEIEEIEKNKVINTRQLY